MSDFRTSWVPAVNFEPRRDGRKPDLLILHYTGMSSAAKAVDWLCREESKVSCHYLIDEDGAVVGMVDEAMRAWHAGISHWQGETDINSCSIGIEIHNGGTDMGLPDYPDAQMRSVIQLSRAIMARHGIPPERVLAHSDIAPARKIDPGERFDWERLAKFGIGVWVPAAPIEGDRGLGVGDSGEAVRNMQAQLSNLGFGLASTGQFDHPTETVVKAFQRHWRQRKVDGRADRSTLLTLGRVAERIGGKRLSS